MPLSITQKLPNRASLAALVVLALVVSACTSGGPIGVSAVSVSPASFELAADATRQLSAEVEANGVSTEVSWETSDETVARVSADGLVTAVSPGAATITARSVADDTKTGTARVTVVEREFTDVPTIEEFEAQVTNGSRIAFEWQADGSTGYALYGVGSGGDIVPLDVDLPRYANRAELPIPDSGHQILRLVATNPVGESFIDLDPLPNVVTSTDDYDPYDGQGWPPEAPIAGTLRAVVEAAEPGSVIGFASDLDELILTGVRLLDGLDAHLYLTKDLTISGPESGLILRGQSGYTLLDPPDGAGGFTYRSRVVYVAPEAEVVLENLTLTGGDFIFFGGGLSNAGNTTLRNVEVTGNRAWSLGGGIFNNGTLTLENSIVSGNFVNVSDDEVGTQYAIRGGTLIPPAPFAPDGYGGGIYNRGTVVMTDSVVEGNHARYNGGGIVNERGSMTLMRTDVVGNDANHLAYDPGGEGDFSGGGGVNNMATFVFEDGDFDSNFAADGGGGLFQGRLGSSTLTTATFARNEADYGGAIRHRYCGDASNLDFVTTPVYVDNVASEFGPDLNASDGAGTPYCAASVSGMALPADAIGTTGPVGEGLPTNVGPRGR